jgi:hypothetical protein
LLDLILGRLNDVGINFHHKFGLGNFDVSPFDLDVAVFASHSLFVFVDN